MFRAWIFQICTKKFFFTLCSVFFVSSLSFIFILLLSSFNLWSNFHHGLLKTSVVGRPSGRILIGRLPGFPKQDPYNWFVVFFQNRGKLSFHGFLIFLNFCDLWTACGQDPSRTASGFPEAGSLHLIFHQNRTSSWNFKIFKTALYLWHLDGFRVLPGRILINWYSRFLGLLSDGRLGVLPGRILSAESHRLTRVAQTCLTTRLTRVTHKSFMTASPLSHIGHTNQFKYSCKHPLLLTMCQSKRLCNFSLVHKNRDSQIGRE